MRMTGIYKQVLLCAVLVISPAAALHGQWLSAPAGPEGVEWHLVEAGGAPVTPMTGGRQPRLLLDPAQKKASGYSGCNNFFGGYELQGSRLTFGLLGTTRRACASDEAALEEKFFGTLGRTRGWNIRDGELLLLDDGGVLARFSAAKREDEAADPGSMTYFSPRFPSGKVTLAHGEFRGPAAPGSASEVVVKVTGKAVFGAVHGRSTGAVVLVSSSGGTGSFYELALLARGAKGWENTDTALLGDRVKVHAVAIENDHVIVDMTTHGPHDPLCCPTLEVKKRFAVRDDRLVPAIEKTPHGQH